MADVSINSGALSDGFRVGRVLGRSLSIFSQNFLMFFLLTTIIHLPSLLFYRNFDLQRPILPSFGSIVLSGTVNLLIYSVSQAIILYAALQVMRGRQISIGEAFQKGLSRLLPLIGLSICVWVSIAIGMMLLLVPGLIVLTMLCVALPACVGERLGPFQSIKRSAKLTKGHRWRIFGIVLVLLIINGVISYSLMRFALPAAGFLIGTICIFLWSIVAGAYQTIAVVVMYHDLRAGKEGVDVNQIGAVFD